MVYLQGGVGTLKYDLLTWLGRDSSALSHYRVGYGVFTVASMQVWVGPLHHGLPTGSGRDCSAWSTYGVW